MTATQLPLYQSHYNDISAIFHMQHDLRETQRLMGEIDGLIPGWPLE
jgi:hypothetical protein